MAAGGRLHIAPAQLCAHLEQLFVRIARESAELREIRHRRLRVERFFVLALDLFQLDRDKAPLVLDALLHRVEQRHILTEQAGAAQRGLALAVKLFLGRGAVAVDDVVAHRHIQHARRDDLVQLLAQQPAVAVEALLLKRVQVNDELHVQSVPDIGQRERLFTALVVHDAQI